MGFTLTVYSHALPGYDREAADDMAALILGDAPSRRRVRMPFVRKPVGKRHENA